MKHSMQFVRMGEILCLNQNAVALAQVMIARTVHIIKKINNLSLKWIITLRT